MNNISTAKKIVKEEPIAIIGIGCRFPGDVNNPADFWELLSEGKNAITEIPKNRWSKRLFYHPDKDREGKIYSPRGGFLEDIDKFDPEFSNELRHDLDINLWGTILSAYIFLPLVSPGGKILMISSAFGLMGPAAYTVYSASKAGIINFAESLRRELLCKNISVHVACPGDIDTPQLHEEHKHMPEWFKQDDPRSMMPPDVAAKKILNRCFKNKFLIIISLDIFSLIMLNKLLPRKLRDYLLDKMFPIPVY
jgi:hypothetical protein